MDIRTGAASLMAQAEGQPAIELIPLGANVFGAEFDPTLRLSFALEHGRATGFTLVQGGVTMQAQRTGDAP